MTAILEQAIIILLGQAKSLWTLGNKITNGQIRSLDELMKANDDLQAKIDAEKQA